MSIAKSPTPPAAIAPSGAAPIPISADPIVLAHRRQGRARALTSLGRRDAADADAHLQPLLEIRRPVRQAPGRELRSVSLVWQTSDALIFAQRPDGRRIKFIRVGATNRWNEDKPTPVAYILKNADGTYAHYTEDNGIEAYDGGGKPLKIANAHGIGWTYTYTEPLPDEDHAHLGPLRHARGRRAS